MSYPILQREQERMGIDPISRNFMLYFRDSGQLISARASEEGHLICRIGRQSAGEMEELSGQVPMNEKDSPHRPLSDFLTTPKTVAGYTTLSKWPSHESADAGLARG
jgi:hypothetical protein